METLIIVIILTTVWFLLGGISCWRMYWGEIKVAHLEHNSDKRLSFNQLFTKDRFNRVYIILLIWGLFSLLLVEIFMPTTWYYKIPKIVQTPKEPEQTDFGKMVN